jgi:hypothetical protein
MGMSEAIWFFGGALAFQTLAKVFRLGQLSNLSIEVGARLLVLIQHTDSLLNEIQEMRYKKMLESEWDSEDLKLIKEMDRKTTEVWRESLIYSFRNSLPGSLKGVYRFGNWDDAMKFLDKHVKRR